MGLFSVLKLRFVVIFTLDDIALLLYLRDIQAAYFQAAMLQHIILDFLGIKTDLGPKKEIPFTSQQIVSLILEYNDFSHTIATMKQQ